MWHARFAADHARDTSIVILNLFQPWPLHAIVHTTPPLRAAIFKFHYPFMIMMPAK